MTSLIVLVATRVGQSDRSHCLAQASSTLTGPPNPHSARGTASAPLPAISCLGAFRTPAASTRGEIVIPAFKNLHNRRHCHFRDLRKGIRLLAPVPVGPRRRGETGMKVPRRNFLHLATGAAALPVISHVARAQTYSSRPARIVVPMAVGGATDIIARLSIGDSGY